MRIQILLLVVICQMFSCSDREESYLQTEAAYSIVSPTQFRSVLFPEGLMLNSEWEVITNDARGGLTVSVPEFESEEITDLPHRINKPDHAIWYRKVIKAEEGVLVLNADDGAQMWINGQRIFNLEKEIFAFKGGQDSSEVIIRVMNNALRGGLRWAKWVSMEDWNAWKKAIESRNQKWRAHIRTTTFENIPDSTSPIFLTDPVILILDSTKTLRWVSDQAGKAEFIYGKDEHHLSQKIEVRSEDGIFSISMLELPQSFHYKIHQNGIETRIFNYRSTNSDQLKFTVWGDSQGGWEVFSSLVNQMNEHHPNFSVGAGDLVGYGSEPEGYPNLLQSLSYGKFHHYPVIGNHDYDGYYDEYIPENYLNYVLTPEAPTYFKWKEANAVFMGIDPHVQFPIGFPNNSPQFAWINQQFESNM